MTTSLRRTGRASIERRSPLSTSLEMSGPATTAALSARTPLYMNTMTIRSCELTSATCSGGSVSPRLLVTVVILLKPHAEKPTTSSVRIRSASRSLRRDASCTVRRAMTRMGGIRSLLRLVLEQLQETILQRLVSRRHLEHAAAHAHDRSDELGNAVGAEAGKRQLLVLVVDAPEIRQLVLVRGREAGDADPNRRAAAEQLIHRARGDDASVV